MSIASLAKLATLSDDARRFEYDHGIWARLKCTVHNTPYAEAVSKLAERRSRKRLSEDEARKLTGAFYDHAVSEWGVGDDAGTRDDFLKYLTSEGLDDVLSRMMTDAGDRDAYRDDGDDAEPVEPADTAEGN